MSDINIVVSEKKEKPGGLRAGHFFRDTHTGQLVFIASMGAEGTPFNSADDREHAAAAIGGDKNGYILRGLFGSFANYEEVDVEIVVTRK